MTDYRTMYDKDFIGAWDLAEGDKTITIKRCKGGELTGVGGRKSKKPVVYFEGSEKGFALNATNGKTIAALYGTHVEKWVGKRITLYKAMTRNPNGDGDVECIRVRPQAPAAGKDGSFAADDDPQPVYVTPDQATELEELCIAKNVETELFKKKAGVERFAQVLAADFEGAKKWIEKTAAGGGAPKK